MAEDPKYSKRRDYNKLVRDRLPKIIADVGKPLSWHTATDEEYRAALWAKLDEEIAELKSEKTDTELADVLEILYAIAESLGTTPQEVERLRSVRASERGTFKQRIILEWS